MASNLEFVLEMDHQPSSVFLFWFGMKLPQWSHGLGFGVRPGDGPSASSSRSGDGALRWEDRAQRLVPRGQIWIDKQEDGARTGRCSVDGRP
ncbi:hypothetical protein NL676_033001 [Syzygium grande]|nr:hypothetical protein NL676_033001 [Syzygium grande]